MPKSLGEELQKAGYFNHIEKEIGLFEEMLTCAKTMQQALIDLSTDDLRKITGEEETFLNQINVMEKERLNFYSGTLSGLVQEAGSPFSPLLSKLQKRWNNIIQELEVINFQNARLLLAAMETNQTIIEGLLYSESQKLPYLPCGIKPHKEPRELFVSRKA